MQLLLITASLFLVAMLVPAWHRLIGRGAAPLSALVAFSGFAWFLTQIPDVADHRFPAIHLAWVPELGVSISMQLDGLSLLFALLVTGVGTLILIYTAGYFKGSPDLPRIIALLLFFMGAMLGLVLSDNLLLLFVFWELTGISSYLLIGFNHEKEVSRRNALQGLLVTGLGGLALLGGFLLIGAAAGTFEASELMAKKEAILASPHFGLALGLVFVGVFTKSAQFPFHFWLPNAMAAPTPVSAYLHSATMVKAGIYLLARLNPTLASAPGWSQTLFSIGATTMLLAGTLGLLQIDLKRILAYTTLAVLGMLTMLIGVGTELAIQSAIFFLLGHALYKAALFLTAGNVDHACHTRDVRRLRGLRSVLPTTAWAATLAACSKAGFPPFFGFLGKEYAYKSGVALNEFSTLVILVAFLGNLMLLALAFKAGIHPYYGRFEESKLDEPPHAVPASMWMPPLLLGVVGLAMGAFPALLAQPLVQAAVSSVEGVPVEFKVKLWHGFNLPLLLTVLTIASGVALYRVRRMIWRRHSEVLKRIPLDFDRAYDRIMAAIVSFSKLQTRVIQSGKLRHYLATIVAVTVTLLGWKLLANHSLRFDLPATPHQPMIYVVIVTMAACAVAAITTTSRITALATLGLTGYGMAFLFANYGAPDLAITQVVVETLTVVFFMTVLHRLPKIRAFCSPRSRWRDAALAGISGALVAWLVLIAIHLQFAPTISSQLAEWSYARAYGRNVVNVILVDFRALDTLGEITVLGIAAIGVLVLLSSQLSPKDHPGTGGAER